MALPAQWIELVENAAIIPLINRSADELFRYERNSHPGKSDYLVLDPRVMDFVNQNLEDDWQIYCLTTHQLLIEYPQRHLEVVNLPEKITRPPIPGYMAGSYWEDDQPASRLCFKSDAIQYLISHTQASARFLDSI